MATTLSQPASASIVYCGESAVFDQWQRSSAQGVRALTPPELADQIRDSLPSLSAIILTLFSTRAGRIEIPAERGQLHQAAAQTMEILAAIQRQSLHPTVVLLTHSGTALELCCDAVRMGVTHFIDTDASGWEDRLNRVLEKAPAAAPERRTADPKDLLDSVGIMATSQAMRNLIVQVYRGAQVSDATVLIHGESGTGKQLIAEAIHHLDPKRTKLPFVPVNCAAITGTLAESELFGHVRGAFSGATESRAGYFRSAHKGTIFLDEISELPLHLQSKLLRVIQEKRVLPVGSDREEPIDVRVIAATNVSLQEKIAMGEFRLDLYQRLNVIHLTVPPLRQRTEDIPLLVTHFVRKYQHYCAEPIREIDPLVFELLKRKSGTGNVRELENVIRQTLVFKSSGDRLELSDLPRYLFDAEDIVVPSEMIPGDVADHLVALIRSRRLTLKQAVETFEKAIIQQAVKASPELTKVELAKVLGLPRRTLYYKLDMHEE